MAAQPSPQKRRRRRRLCSPSLNSASICRYVALLATTTRASVDATSRPSSPAAVAAAAFTYPAGVHNQMLSSAYPGARDGGVSHGRRPHYYGPSARPAASNGWRRGRSVTTTTTTTMMALPGVRTNAALRSALFRGPGRTAASSSGRAVGGGRLSPTRGPLHLLGLMGRLGGWRRGPTFNQRGRNGSSSSSSLSSSSSTALHMVLTTPESIIEEASTQNLLDDLIDESVRTLARKPVMMQFDPSSGWIWRRWKGTVFSETWPSVIRNMIVACCVSLVYRMAPGFKEKLSGFSILWGQLLSVTTFTLTFFLNQSYALWRKCYELSRRLQGRLNDLGMTMASHATRKTPPSPEDTSPYTPQARQVLELMSRYVRVFNLLTYASFTRSHRPILTPRGMRRLVERGLITAQEREVLVNTELPATQRHNAIIMWIIRVFIEGRQSGHIDGGAGFEQQFMEKCHVIRAQYGAIGDELQGRMPLAYAHIVQVLVDVILWMYPFMAFSTGMTPFLGVLGTGLLTMFYQGLFDLAKQFLDPYDNENYGKGEDPLCVDTLIAETNAGSVRWLNGFEEQPFSSQRLKEGEMFDYMLPLRGYTVAELEEMEMQAEKERLRREAELEEKKEAERLKKEQEEAERILLEQEEMERAKLQNATGVALEEGGVNGNVTESAESAEGTETAETSVPTADFVGEAFEGVFPGAVDQEEKPSIHTVISLETGEPITVKNNFEADVVEADGQESTPAVEGEPVPSSVGPVKAEKDINLQEADLSVVSRREKKSEVSVGANITAEVPEVNGDSAVLREKVNGDGVDESAVRTPTVVGGGQPESGADPDMYQTIDLGDMLDTVDWFEETGEDGSEYRLSQMLAEEVWEEELEREESKLEEKPMSFEEYTKKATEIIEAVEEEMLETEQIMNASPGEQASIDVKKRKKVEGMDGKPALKRKSEGGKKASVAVYDQTKLDGISQLWGAPPELLDMSPRVEPMKELRYEDYPFEGISSLWGGAFGAPEAKVTPSDKAEREVSFGGISQLWADGGDDGKSEPRTKKLTVDADFGEDGDWFNEIGPDGKEYRLSQMLADEEWEEEFEAEPAPAMTLEDYSKQAAAIADAAEDEFLETEAILNAPPNANAFEVSDDLDRVEATVDEEIRHKKLDASTETIAVAKGVMEIAEEVMEEAEEQIDAMQDAIDDSLLVLDMDVETLNSTGVRGYESVESPSATVADGETSSKGDTPDSRVRVGDATDGSDDQTLPPDVDTIR